MMGKSVGDAEKHEKILQKVLDKFPKYAYLVVSEDTLKNRWFSVHDQATSS
jgi:hypothetical protein